MIKKVKKKKTKKVKKRVKPIKRKKMSFLKRKKSAREISEEITDGERPPEHLGKHSPETIHQEIFSLANTKPLFRDQKWHERAAKLAISINEVLQQKRRPRGQYEGLLSKLNAIRLSNEV